MQYILNALENSFFFGCNKNAAHLNHLRCKSGKRVGTFIIKQIDIPLYIVYYPSGISYMSTNIFKGFIKCKFTFNIHSSYRKKEFCICEFSFSLSA